MLDANIRNLKKGSKFFAKAYSVDRQGKLYNLGLRKGDLVFCHMLTSDKDKPLVDLTIGDKILTVSSKTEKYYTRLTYEGNQNLSDFICEESRFKAFEINKKMDGK